MARKRIINEKSTEILYEIGLDKNGNKNWKSKIVFNALLHLDKTKYYEIYEMQMFCYKYHGIHQIVTRDIHRNIFSRLWILN